MFRSHDRSTIRWPYSRVLKDLAAKGVVCLVVWNSLAAAFSMQERDYGRNYSDYKSDSDYKNDSGSNDDPSYSAAAGKSADRVYVDTQDAGLGYGAGRKIAHFQPPYDATGDYRQPTAIVPIHDELAIIPTKRSGEIFALNLSTLACTKLFEDRSRQWGSAIRLTDSDFAVIDHGGDEVVIFQRREDRWQAIAAFACPGHPRQMAWVPEQRRFYVSGQWSQRLYRFQLPSDSPDFAELEQLTPIDLPIRGGAILPLVKRSAVIVMDTFSRDFVVLDAVTVDGVLSDDQKIVKHDRIYGHNVPGLLAVDDEQRVMFVHQLLNEFAQSTRGDITWGGLLSNNIRWLQAERMLDPAIQGAEMFSKSKFFPVGMTGDGAGDPTSLRLSTDGQLAITIGGTSRLAFGRVDDLDLHQVDTGLRPVDSCFTPDNRRIVVVSQFSDSLSVVTTADRSVQHVPLGALREPTPVERGEQLFFDSRFSHDGWMSCHSCHSEGHTSDQSNDNLTDGTFGSPKRIVSLLGQAETGPYSWSGKFEQLEEQVFHSLRSTMATDNAISQQAVDDIAAYVRTLPAPPSLKRARGKDSSPTDHHEKSVEQGRELFRALGCAQCHAGQTFTSSDVYDVGLVDEQGLNQFNPPSLIGVSQRHALLHDGSARRVQQVIEDIQHQLEQPLEPTKIQALVDFLESL